jgi:hypothetical protein
MPYVTPRRRAVAATAAAVLAALTIAGPATAATAPIGNTPPPYLPGQGAGPDATAQGFIMGDGRICDPIRHMGC